MTTQLEVAARPCPRVARDLPTVCQVLHSLDVGGAEMLAARLAQSLSDRFRFVFACLDELGTLGEELRAKGFTVEVLHRRSGIDLKCVRKLAAFARAENADLIHAHQYTPFFYARAPGWIGRRLPVLFTEHGRFHPDQPNPKRMVFNRLFLRRRDRVAAVGESVRQALVANEWIPHERIDVIHNGARLDDYVSPPGARLRLREELGLGVTDRVAIQVARLDYLKDHDTALRTAERVRQEFSDFRLLLVGEGPERAKIEQDIARRKLERHVFMLGLRTDVHRLLAAADVFLLTSISEGIPVTLIEAMGASLAIVSTAVGGVEEVVINGKTGLVAPAGNDEALAAALVRLFNRPDENQEMGAAGRCRAELEFSEHQMHARYAEHYWAMLSKSAHRRVLRTDA